MNEKRLFSGKNLEDALSQAAKYFNVDQAFVCYNTQNSQSGNLFSRLFSRSIQIEAWVETVKEDLQEAARQAVRDALTQTNPMEHTPKKALTKKKSHNGEKNTTLSSPNAIAVASSYEEQEKVSLQSPETQKLLETYNEVFFQCFGIEKSNYKLTTDGENIVIHVNDDNFENLLGKSDKLSLSYEHVCKRIAQKKLGDISSRLSLDSGAAQKKREEHLIQVARSMAEKVIKTRKSIVLSSKSSQERRIIHMALDNFEGIATKSVGMGEKRKLVIYSLHAEQVSKEFKEKNSKAYKPKKQKPSQSQKVNTTQKRL